MNRLPTDIQTYILHKATTLLIQHIGPDPDEDLPALVDSDCPVLTCHELPPTEFPLDRVSTALHRLNL